MDQHRLAFLLDRYVRRICTSAELDELMHAVNQGGSQDYLEKLLDEFWERSEEVPLQPLASQRIFGRSIEAVPPVAAWRRPWLGWAAAFFVVLSTSLLWWRSGEDHAPLAQRHVSAPVQPAEPVKPLTVATEGTHQRVVLPDGSSVVLNVHSRLAYPEKFGNKRQVSLEGEGYFDIKHQEGHPFIVKAGSIQTTVLGTAFNVKAYANQAVQVTVTRGRVQVAHRQSILGILSPNQQVVFENRQRKASVNHVDAKAVVQWQENDLFFDDVTLEEAAAMLTAKFGTPITFANPEAKKCRFSATFLNGEPLEEILKVICAFHHAQYQTSSAGITIRGGGC